jgi:hypothetical protein
MRTNSTPDAVDCFNIVLSSPVLRLLSDRSANPVFLVAMALIDKVPGDLKLYIGGYVMQTTVSNSPTASVCPSGVCDN